jgi:hypothetical protein
MERIYRVEHKVAPSPSMYCIEMGRTVPFRLGPYGHRIAYELPSGMYTCPPSSDPGLKDHRFSSNWFFGFRDVDMMKRWFPIKLYGPLFSEYGFVARVYRGAEVKHGSYQSIINVEAGVELLVTLDLW